MYTIVNGRQVGQRKLISAVLTLTKFYKLNSFFTIIYAVLGEENYPGDKKIIRM